MGRPGSRSILPAGLRPRRCQDALARRWCGGGAPSSRGRARTEGCGPAELTRDGVLVEAAELTACWGQLVATVAKQHKCSILFHLLVARVGYLVEFLVLVVMRVVIRMHAWHWVAGHNASLECGQGGAVCVMSHLGFFCFCRFLLIWQPDAAVQISRVGSQGALHPAHLEDLIFYEALKP